MFPVAQFGVRMQEASFSAALLQHGPACLLHTLASGLSSPGLPLHN